MVDRYNDAVAKEVEVDAGQDNLRMNMNSPLLPPLPPLLVLESSVEEAKRLLLLLLLMLNNNLYAYYFVCGVGLCRLFGRIMYVPVRAVLFLMSGIASFSDELREST